jgi:hypothetical protein
MSEQEHEEHESPVIKAVESVENANTAAAVVQAGGMKLPEAAEALEGGHVGIPVPAWAGAGMKGVGLVNGINEMAHAKDVQHGIGAGADTLGNAVELGGMAAKALGAASPALEAVPVIGQAATAFSTGVNIANSGLDSVKKNGLLGEKEHGVDERGNLTGSWEKDKDGNLVPVKRDFIDYGVDVGKDFNHTVRDATGSELLGDIAGGVGGVLGTVGGAVVTVGAGLVEGVKSIGKNLIDPLASARRSGVSLAPRRRTRRRPSRRTTNSATSSSRNTGPPTRTGGRKSMRWKPSMTSGFPSRTTPRRRHWATAPASARWRRSRTRWTTSRRAECCSSRQ